MALFDKDKDERVTEFNSSVATLVRIDELLKSLHLARLSADKIKKYRRYHILDSLFIEANGKLKPEEKEICRKYYENITGLLINNKRSILTSAKNRANTNAWDILLSHIRDYEIYLIGLLDKHGMLMTNAKRGMEKFLGN